MKTKFFLTLFLFFLQGSVALAKTNSSFRYEYEIYANSFSPSDEVALYYFKEDLISLYEEKVMDLDKSYISEYLINNIDIFSFGNDNIVSSYIEGRICLKIGKGKGKKIKGKLKRNYCDEEALQKKIYIFDILR